MSRKQRREKEREEGKKNSGGGGLMAKVKKASIWIVVLAVVGFLGYKFVNFLQAPAPQTNPELVNINDKDHVRGNKDAKAVLVEYGDFQCPACGTYYPLVKNLEKDFPDNLAVVFRNFPLTTIHQNAMNGAKAAEAANLQGKFWKMHDMLFENQDEWSGLSNPEDTFISYAEKIGIDKDKFQADYKSQEVQDKINADVKIANQLGINATPTFYLNGKKLTNPTSYDAFKSLVQSAVGN